MLGLLVYPSKSVSGAWDEELLDLSDRVVVNWGRSVAGDGHDCLPNVTVSDVGDYGICLMGRTSFFV